MEIKIKSGLVLGLLLGLGGCQGAIAPLQDLIAPPKGAVAVTFRLKPDQGNPVQDSSLAAVGEALEKRGKALGLRTSVKLQPGQQQVTIQIKGMTDPTQAARVFGKTARLEFREQKPGSQGQFMAESQVLRDLEIKVLQLQDSKNKSEIDKNTSALNRTKAAIANCCFQPTELSGKNVIDAYATNNSSQWSVGVTFDREGSEKFTALTKRAAERGLSIGIFLDDVPISTPSVSAEYKQSGITGGAATISGNFDAKAASELASQLKSGALPAAIEVVEAKSL